MLQHPLIQALIAALVTFFYQKVFNNEQKLSRKLRPAVLVGGLVYAITSLKNKNL